MAGRRGIPAGKAWVEIHGDNNPLSRALNAAGAKLKKWGASVTKIGLATAAAGSAILGPLLAAAKAFAAAGDDVDKMSKRVGASAEFVSALSHAAQLGGTNIANMETGIRRLQRAAFDAAAGSTSTGDAFRQLGVDVKDSAGNLKTTENLFMETATALSELENNTQKAALAQVLFGRAGTSLLPMLNDGARGLAAAMEEAKRLGLVMTQEDATAAAALTDAWLRLTSTTKRLSVQVGGALAPTLTDLADRTAPLITQTIDWVREHSALIVQIAAGAAGLIALGGVLVTAGGALTAAGFAATGLAAGLAVTKVAALALLSPLGLVTAGLVGLTAYALYASEGSRAAFGAMADDATALGADVAATFRGIQDAMSAGDFQKAADVLWAGLKVSWLDGTNTLTKMWTDFKFSAARIFTELWTGVRVIWADATAAIQKAWLATTTSLTTAWDAASTTIAKGIGWMIAKAQGSNPAEIQAIIEEDHQRRQKQRDAGAQSQRAAIDAEHRETLAGLGAEQAATMAALDAMHRDAASDAAANLARARAEWEDALTAARQAADTARSDHSTLGSGPDMPELDPEGWRAASGSIRGTFSAAAVAGMGSTDDHARRTAVATEGTWRAIKDLMDKLHLPVFE
ncbi:MAG: phage tail tape measure protein [Phycisphaerae bacterium]|nr:phage tail tape measure protein [Phycisphaerae bacterium]